MTPAERLAALRAIKEGIDEAIADAQTDVREAMQTTGADRFATDLGRVANVKGSSRVRFDEDKLIEFAEQVAAWEVHTVKKVRRTFRDQFEADDGMIIYRPTGEVADVGTVTTTADHLMVSLTDDAKQGATQAIKERTQALVRLLAIDGSAE